MSKEECVGDACSLYFHEISEKGKQVINMQGCAIMMASQYLMEMRPRIDELTEIPKIVSELTEIRHRANSITIFQEKIQEKIHYIWLYVSNISERLHKK